MCTTQTTITMKSSICNHDGHVLIRLEGRLDTSTTSQAQADIERQLLEAGSIKSLTLNLSGLDYISSSGLRLLLHLAKTYNEFRLEEVQPVVYDVLQMTGFTKVMSVERALRQLSVDGCEVFGVGGVGIVYRIDGDTIIKVFREGTTMDEVKAEITMSKEAFVLGMPTPISFDVVRVGEQYGLVYELLQADTLSACVRREPGRLDEFARKYAQLFRQLHSISVPATSNVPSAMTHELEAVRHVGRYFPQESIGLMLEILNAVPEGDRLLHLDLQTKNAMMQGDELMLIDMGEIGYGHPILDLAHAYSAMVTLVGDYEKIIGMPKSLGQELWERAIGYYFEGETPELIAHRKEQIEAVSCVRNFSWLSLSDSFPQEVIDECRRLFEVRIGSRKEHLLKVCATLDDWKV